MSTCIHCGFTLFNPIKELSVSRLGLYNDTRFSGRCILSLNEHYDHFEDVTLNTQISFIQNINDAVHAMKNALHVERVNIAILGNTVAHVHAHLIPRYPTHETHPNKAPWEDTRIKEEFSFKEVEHLTNEIRNHLNMV